MAVRLWKWGMGGGMTPESHPRPPRPVWHTTKNSFTSCFDMSNIGPLLLVKRSYLFFFPIPLPFCVQSASRFILQGVYACVRKIRLWECAGREGCMTADSGSWNLPFPLTTTPSCQDWKDVDWTLFSRYTVQAADLPTSLKRSLREQPPDYW